MPNCGFCYNILFLKKLSFDQYLEHESYSCFPCICGEVQPKKMLLETRERQLSFRKCQFE